MSINFAIFYLNLRRCFKLMMANHTHRNLRLYLCSLIDICLRNFQIRFTNFWPLDITLNATATGGKYFYKL